MQASNLPPLDSISFWPQVTGLNASAARRELLLNGAYYDATGLKLWGGGQDAVWTGEFYPNASTDFKANAATKLSCGRGGCLFDVGGADPGEHTDLAASRPKDVARMRARAQSLSREHPFRPSRGKGLDVRACNTIDLNSGFWGPWADNGDVSVH